MRLTNILHAVRFEPWAILPTAHATISEIVLRAASGQMQTAELSADAFVNQRPEMSIDENGTATIAIVGPLLSKSTLIERTCGITDYSQIRAEMSMAKEMGAQRIIFKMDSPGGMVLGCQETASDIRNIGLPTSTMVEGQACSAAYWLASQTDIIYATPSSVIGSIGVIMPWIDQDARWEQMGIKWNPITNDGADLKGMGGGPSLTADQRQFLTDSANQTAEEFWQAVTEVRDLPEELKRAGFYKATQAIMIGLIDQLI